MHRLQELVRLHRMNCGGREVARLLKMSPNTERQYRVALAAAGLLEGSAEDLPTLEVIQAAVKEHAPGKEAPQQVSSIERWTAVIEELLGKGVKPRAIYDRLRLEEEEFAGSYWAIKRLCRSLKRSRGVQPEDVALPVETKPGEVAQVDFGYVGTLYDPELGVRRKAWAFVLVLGYSRHMVARVAFDQKQETWLRLHVEAFAELGGVVETVVPDNLKAAVVRAAFGVDGETELNRSYRELARYYGFKIDPTPPRDPRKKGKVEAGVKYVKGSYFAGRKDEDAQVVQAGLGRWVKEIAGLRRHGTTGWRPLEEFERVEQEALHALPGRPYDPVVWKLASVHPDSHVLFDRRLYSVPFPLIGQRLWVQATATTVAIYAKDSRVATHDRRGRGLRSTKEEHLPEHRAPWRHRSRDFWQERAERLGPEVSAYVREIFDTDVALSMLRTVQAVVVHLESFPRERAEAACRRARYFGNYSYGGIKDILRKGLDLLPLPALVAPPAPTLPAPRFARDINELLHPGVEVCHEPN
jgi:transposase